MKLNSARIDQAARQLQAQALADDHPLTQRLNGLFGDHTFFLDRNGLNIVEPGAPNLAMPAEGDGESAEAVQVVELASWADEARNSLVPHDPEFTDIVVMLDKMH
jgi:hypothetical protein